MAAAVVPIVDLSAFTGGSDTKSRQDAAQELAAKLRVNGSVGILGHGISAGTLKEAFLLSRDFFNLSYEDKMTAPHPAGAAHHRGYSSPGSEQGAASLGVQKDGHKKGDAITQVKDYKESFELGSEQNQDQKNIWPLEHLVPGFRQSTVSLHWVLQNLALSILDALAMGLGLTEKETTALRALHTGHENQTRLLHYPPRKRQTFDNISTMRLGAHRDWSTFTLLFQDEIGGLEFHDRVSDTYVPAEPKDGVVYLNIGDTFNRYSNDIFPSAMHRVVALRALASHDMTPSRYSIPYFVVPKVDQIIAPPETLVASSGTAVFEPTTFVAYATKMMEAIRA